MTLSTLYFVEIENQSKQQIIIKEKSDLKLRNENVFIAIEEDYFFPQFNEHKLICLLLQFHSTILTIDTCDEKKIPFIEFLLLTAIINLE